MTNYDQKNHIIIPSYHVFRCKNFVLTRNDSKTSRKWFYMIENFTLNQSSNTKQNYAAWILTALLFILKPKIFTKGIAIDVEEQFDTTNCDNNRPLPLGKNK